MDKTSAAVSAQEVPYISEEIEVHALRRQSLAQSDHGICKNWWGKKML